MSKSYAAVGSQQQYRTKGQQLGAVSLPAAAGSLGIKQPVLGKSAFDPLFQCLHCSTHPGFATATLFKQHLRGHHCKIEGGSFVCLYGSNAVCASLPLEGVNDTDYEQHVTRQHIYRDTRGSSTSSMASESGGRGGSSSGGRRSEETWGILSPVQNLPSALHNPKRGSIQRDFFTKTWGESFVEARTIPPHVALPQVTPRHVEGYLKRMRKRNKLLQKLQQHDQQQQLQQADDENNKFWSPSLAVEAGSRVSSSQSTSAIPSIFFSPNFNLEDPATFYSVFSHLAPHHQKKSSVTNVAGVDVGGAAAVANTSKTRDGQSTTEAKKIQEKLLQHLEVVESKMCSHIASKSSAFFQSMSHLSVHMEQLRQNQLAVSKLRSGISQLHNEAVETPIKLLALPRRRQNILSTHKILEVMSVVREVQGTIRVMLGRREFITALDLITTASQLLENDLTTIRSFRNMSGELSEQVRIIEKMVSIDFTKYVTEDLNRPIDDHSPLLEEDQLIAVVFGVLRLNKMDFLDNLKEEIYAAVNATVKQCVAESVSSSSIAGLEDTSSNSNSSGGAVVGEQAKCLPLHEWLNLLQHLTHCLHHLLQRYKAIMSVMVQAVEASAGMGQPAAEGVQAATIVNMSGCGGVGSAWCSRVVGALQDGLCQACDFAHDRCAKLLHARSRNNGLAKMSVKEFMALSGVIEGFVSATERICGKKSSPFRMGLQGQCVVFVQRFHTDREGRLRANLSNERWKPVPAPRDLQLLCQHIDSSGRLTYAATVTTTSSNSSGIHSTTITTTTTTTTTTVTTNGVATDTSDNESTAVVARESIALYSSDDNRAINSDSDSAVFSDCASVAITAAYSDSNANNSDSSSSAIYNIRKNITSSGKLLSVNQRTQARHNNVFNNLSVNNNFNSNNNHCNESNIRHSQTNVNLLASINHNNGTCSSKPSVVQGGESNGHQQQLLSADTAAAGEAGFHQSHSAPNLCDVAAAAGDADDGASTNGGGAGGAVLFGGEEYVVVGVGVVVVRLIVEYAECASTLQIAAQSLLAGLADLLRRFNSDTCRLLLEAGAVSLGGLRTISTRHLALAHRCLHLLLALLPHLHAHYSTLIKPAIVDKTVSQLEREFREHCSALEAKIISVVGDQLDRLLAGWEARSPVPSQAMTGILKALTRLHEAITGVLTQKQMCSVFARLTVSLREKLKTHLMRLNVMPVGPQSWVVTSELTFYFNHLASLKVDPECTQEQFSKLLWAAEPS
uniref:Vacuolar protein sorting-associated protein 54 n=1 Tax=Hirondellea gigas TaxID=1518452 RepID=A0A6A7FVS6_9CRUS